MITVYGINNCDTIKKTLNWLKENQLDFEFHDYRKHGISHALINELLDQFDLMTVINRRGSTWRKLPDSTKDNLDRELAASLMSSLKN
jgi:arsenate reductase